MSHFVNKAASLRELERLVQPYGLILLMWDHNVLSRLLYGGRPLPSERYQALVADIPHRLVADCDILSRYRQKQCPSLTRMTDAEPLATIAWTNLVAGMRVSEMEGFPEQLPCPCSGTKMDENGAGLASVAYGR
jgi:hypothetical protein